jgi:hypothetical protein
VGGVPQISVDRPRFRRDKPVWAKELEQPVDQLSSTFVRTPCSNRLVRLLTTVRKKFDGHRHSAFLAALIGAFAVRPLIGEGADGLIVFTAALMVLVIIGLYNVNVDELMEERENPVAQRRRAVIGLTLVAAAFAERLAVLFYVHNHWLDLIGSTGWLLMFSFVTWSMLRNVLRQKEVTSDTISASISVYL